MSTADGYEDNWVSRSRLVAELHRKGLDLEDVTILAEWPAETVDGDLLVRISPPAPPSQDEQITSLTRKQLRVAVVAILIGVAIGVGEIASTLLSGDNHKNNKPAARHGAVRPSHAVSGQ